MTTDEEVGKLINEILEQQGVDDHNVIGYRSVSSNISGNEKHVVKSGFLEVNVSYVISDEQGIVVYRSQNGVVDPDCCDKDKAMEVLSDLSQWYSNV